MTGEGKEGEEGARSLRVVGVGNTGASVLLSS